MYFILNITYFVVSLDSSACLGNNILPNMFSLILHLRPLPPPKKKFDQKVISMVEQHHMHLYNFLKKEQNMAL